MPAETVGFPKVLAVDDSLVVHQLIKRVLEPDYEVLMATSAVDGLSMIYHDTIAVVLLDILMPDVDGLEFCRTVRRLPQFQTLPIVMVTSRDSPFDRVQGHMAGATEYLTKPFSAEQLRQVVDNLVKQPA